MTCDQARKQWHEAWDAGAENASAENAGVEIRADQLLETHLSTCSSCRRYVEQMSMVADAFDELRAVTHDAPFAVAGDSAAAEEHLSWPQRPVRQTRLSPWYRSRGLGLAAAVAFAALLGVAVFRDSMQEDSGAGSVRTTSMHAAVQTERSSKDSPVRVVGEKAFMRITPNHGALDDEEGIGITLRGGSAGTRLATAMPSEEPNVQMYWIVPVVGGEQVLGDS